MFSLPVVELKIPITSLKAVTCCGVLSSFGHHMGLGYQVLNELNNEKAVGSLFVSATNVETCFLKMKTIHTMHSLESYCRELQIFNLDRPLLFAL